MILADMADGRLADGARLPPEREMAARMGVAVGTLRRALANIEERGLLERVQGSGNYVRTERLGVEVYGFFRLEHADGGRGRPTAATLSLARMKAPAGLVDPAIRIRRLRRLDGIPIALEEIWLGGIETVPDIAMMGDSLYLTASAMMGLRIDTVEDRVSVGKMPDWAGGEVGLVAGAACGYVTREGRDRRGDLREMSETWYDPSRAHYVQRAGLTLPPPRSASEGPSDE